MHRRSMSAELKPIDQRVEESKGDRTSGVFLVAFEPTPIDGYLFHPARLDVDPIHVSHITINGSYIGSRGHVELECNDYVYLDDGDTIDIKMSEYVDLESLYPNSA